MTAGVEQLHYTWAARGVEGVNRFQIAAMSPGFKSGPVAVTLPVVRKICRYDRPKGDPEAKPRSFGWFDHRQHRIAFCRIGLPPIRGKVGNFAAHVLVGPIAQMPEPAIASTFGSSFWWAGETDGEKWDPVLPTVEMSAIPAAADGQGDIEHTAALVHALLTLSKGERLTVTGSDGAFGRAVREIATRVPEALRGLSLSTYEGVPTYPFRVVGGRGTGGRQRVCRLDGPDSADDPARLTAESLISAERRHGPLQAFARHDLRGDADTDRQLMWRRASTVVGLVSDGRLEDGSRIEDVLENADALAYVAGAATGRERLAEALCGMPAGGWRAFPPALRAMEPGVGEALCAAVAARFEAGDSLRHCSAAAAAMAGMSSRATLCGAVARSALAGGAAAASLTADDTAMVLGYVGAQGAAVATLQTLLAVTARHAARCASEPAVPDAYLVAMVTTLMEGDGNAEAVAAALAARPALASVGALDPEGGARSVAVLGALRGPERARALGALLPLIREESHGSRVLELVRELPARAAADGLVAAIAGPVATPDWSAALNVDVAARLLTDPRAADDRGAVPDALALLEGSGSDMAQTAARTLRGIAGTGGTSAALLLRDAAGLGHLRLREALIELALDAAVATIRRQADVSALWGELRSARRSEAVAETLRRVLAVSAARQDGIQGGLILVWVARTLLPSYPELVSGMGRFRDRELERLAREVSAAVPTWWLEELRPAVEETALRSRQWWRTLESQRRKALAARPVGR